MSDEGRASVATALWCIAFNSGIILAAEHKALGFMLAISATLIFLVYLAEEAKAEHIKSAKDNRLEKYKEDCARREQEALKNARHIDSDTDTHR
jgi:high-affinity K+ transport system ATPase subunit B